MNGRRSGNDKSWRPGGEKVSEAKTDKGEMVGGRWELGSLGPSTANVCR